MPTNIGNEINHSVLATRVSGVDSSGVFAAIQLRKRNVDILVKSITWGCIVPDATDRTNFIGAYAMLVRNMPFNSSNTFSAVAPVGLPSGSDLLWVQSLPALGTAHANFDGNLILPAGNDYALVVPAPALSAGNSGTLYMFGSINADLQSFGEMQKWNMS